MEMYRGGQIVAKIECSKAVEVELTSILNIAFCFCYFKCYAVFFTLFLRWFTTCKNSRTTENKGRIPPN